MRALPPGSISLQIYVRFERRGDADHPDGLRSMRTRFRFVIGVPMIVCFRR